MGGGGVDRTIILPAIIACDLLHTVTCNHLHLLVYDILVRLIDRGLSSLNKLIYILKSILCCSHGIKCHIQSLWAKSYHPLLPLRKSLTGHTMFFLFCYFYTLVTQAGFKNDINFSC